MTTPAPFDPLFLELQEALVGRYSLERELGRGGMGTVYLARDVRLDRLVAIKLLPPALAERPALRDRFLREARTAARLSHPGIVAIHAVEEAGRLVYFVMAYVAGESLGERLRRQGAIVPADAATILRDAAWALGHAHSQGVIHRDVMPDNILLERSGGRSCPPILASRHHWMTPPAAGTSRVRSPTAVPNRPAVSASMARAISTPSASWAI